MNYQTYLFFEGRTEYIQGYDTPQHTYPLGSLMFGVLDLDAAAPAGWQDDRRPDIPPQKRVVWEVSVRDFSQDAASGVRPDWRGKFLAFTQPGTTLCGDGTHPTCLNYLQQLGVGYVQIIDRKSVV